MFGIRTPPPSKALNVTVDIDRKSPAQTQKASPSMAGTSETATTSKVRRSIGEWETGKAATASTSRSTEAKPKLANSPKKAPAPATSKPKPKTGLASDSKAMAQKSSAEAAERSPMAKVKYADRLAEAKACLTKAKVNLGSAKNLKTEIKIEVTIAIDRLYQLVKEGESVKGKGSKEVTKEPEEEKEKEKGKENREREESMLLEKMAKHAQLIEESNERMEKLKEAIERHQEVQERLTYASVTAGSPKQPPENIAMHSIIISSKDDHETGDQVYERIRKVVNAAEEGTKIDKIRKAKDRKIIVGCQNEEELRKVKKRIAEGEGQLNIEDIKNKDPLVILYGVLQCHTDEDIIKAIRTQNGHLLKGVSGEDDRMEVRFRRKARNPLISHVVIKVSPRLWQCLTNAGTVYIDVQRIRVADQSPLVQCSRCLGYGHGRRFCTEAVDVCSHCGGAHLKPECPDWLSEATPSCVNCVKNKAVKIDHGAFSNECPVRRKWEALARSTVAYC